MIVLIIDEFRVAVIECESQPPVSADTHAPVVRKLPLEGVQSPARDVHVRRLSGDIERRELSRQPRRMRGLDASLAAGSEEPPDALVAKRSYHRAGVARGATLHKRQAGDVPPLSLAGGSGVCRSHSIVVCRIVTNTLPYANEKPGAVIPTPGWVESLQRLVRRSRRAGGGESHDRDAPYGTRQCFERETVCGHR